MAQYLALPPGDGRHPAVVVIHEWWGVNEQIKAVADRWAKEGFVAIVPDLFHGKVAELTKPDEAAALMNALDFPGAVKEIAAAVGALRDHPRSTGKIAITGYCMGGALTFLSACNVPGLAALVPFYGLPPGGDWAKVDAPVQAHFAMHDDWATVDGAKKIQAQLSTLGKKMELHVYDAKHAFCNDRRPEVHDPEAAAQAWERAVGFVRACTS
jgi:carboxymethylenebutenolidase